MVSPSFADAVASLTYLEPFTEDHGCSGCIIAPASFWPASLDDLKMHGQQPSIQLPDPSTAQLLAQKSPSGSSSVDLYPRPSTLERPPATQENTPTSMATSERPPSAQGSASDNTMSYSTNFISLGDREKTSQARYAANQRHSKAQKARKDSHQNESARALETRNDERKQRQRENNKIAAAKCRSRQRRRVQMIQEKGSHLGKKNVELKTMIQKLREELNNLRYVALNHQGCHCHVAQYNSMQAKKILTNHCSSYSGHEYEGHDPLGYHLVHISS